MCRVKALFRWTQEEKLSSSNLSRWRKIYLWRNQDWLLANYNTNGKQGVIYLQPFALSSSLLRVSRRSWDWLLDDDPEELVCNGAMTNQVCFDIVSLLYCSIVFYFVMNLWKQEGGRDVIPADANSREASGSNTVCILQLFIESEDLQPILLHLKHHLFDNNAKDSSSQLRTPLFWNKKELERTMIGTGLYDVIVSFEYSERIFRLIFLLL